MLVRPRMSWLVAALTFTLVVACAGCGSRTDTPTEAEAKAYFSALQQAIEEQLKAGSDVEKAVANIDWSDEKLGLFDRDKVAVVDLRSQGDKLIRGQLRAEKRMSNPRGPGEFSMWFTYSIESGEVLIEQ
ncbi:MAG: hypothetical protein H6839_15030 [Planctomycetes bacterium]|nr:hypothetical protein [Planctomycetota bacterium]